MKTCNICNQKKAGLKHFAVLHKNVIKLAFTCNNCKVELRKSGIPMVEASRQNFNIKLITEQLTALIEKNKKTQDQT